MAVTLWPVAFSNCGTRSDITCRTAFEASTLISAACAAATKANEKNPSVATRAARSFIVMEAPLLAALSQGKAQPCKRRDTGSATPADFHSLAREIDRRGDEVRRLLLAPTLVAIVGLAEFGRGYDLLSVDGFEVPE